MDAEFVDAASAVPEKSRAAGETRHGPWDEILREAR